MSDLYIIESFIEKFCYKMCREIEEVKELSQ